MQQNNRPIGVGRDCESRHRDLYNSIENEVFPKKSSVVPGCHDHREGNDDYTRAGNLFCLMMPEQQERLMDNIMRTMEGRSGKVALHQSGPFQKSDPAYGEDVARRVGVDLARATAAE